LISLNLQNIALNLQNIALIYTLISLDLQNIALYQYIVIHNARSKQIIQIFTQLTFIFILFAVF